MLPARGSRIQLTRAIGICSRATFLCEGLEFEWENAWLEITQIGGFSLVFFLSYQGPSDKLRLTVRKHFGLSGFEFHLGQQTLANDERR